MIKLPPLYCSHSHTSEDEEGYGEVFFLCLRVDDGEEICRRDIEE